MRLASLRRMRVPIWPFLPWLLVVALVGCGESNGPTSDSSGGTGGSSATGGTNGGSAGNKGGGGGSIGGSGAASGTGGGAGSTGGTFDSGGASASGGSAGSPTTGGAAGEGGTGTGGNAGTPGDGPACPGVAPRADVPGTTCRSQDDCRNGATCAPEYGVGCGAQLPAQRLCESDQDCGDGKRCVEATVRKPCEDGLETSCIPECTADSCGDGERCSNGLCEPVPCMDGFTCDELYVCAPDRAGADAHGCAPRNCNEGYDCDAGYSCDTQSGSCSAVHCREGGDAACPINFVCDDATGGRGCVPKPCATDEDCDCGACLHTCTGEKCPPGSCGPRLNLCVEPVA